MDVDSNLVDDEESNDQIEDDNSDVIIVEPASVSKRPRITDITAQ